MLAVDTDSVTLAGAFILGAILATAAMLRVLRAVTAFFTGLERRHRDRHDDPDD